MNISARVFATLRLCVVIACFTLVVSSQTVPAPKDVLGWTPGDDRKLASWSQVVEYFKKLDAASDRVQFQEIGKTTMGAPFVYATISSSANLNNLEEFKRINARLADPRKYRNYYPKGYTGARVGNPALFDIVRGKTIVLI